MGKNNNNTQNNNVESQTDLPVENETATENKTSVLESNVKSEGLIKIKARTITKKGHYYRAGFSFIVTPKEYAVNAEVLKVLKADKWLEIETL